LGRRERFKVAIFEAERAVFTDKGFQVPFLPGRERILLA
jgi:hypothetical protein